MDQRERAGEQPLNWALGALLVAGALIRSYAYARRGALWTDEAGLALNFVGRGIDQIARPFVYDQYAPYLYLLGDKLITLALGASEYALRFGSLLGGVLLLPCVAILARRVLDRRAALFALLILTLNWLTIEYSAELKPYILDAVVAAWLCLLAVPVVVEPKPKLAPLAAAGVLAPWLSLPSIFTLAACGAAMLLDGWTRRLGARALALRVAIGGLWLVSFATHFFTFLNAESNSANLQSYWAAADAFAPFPAHSVADLRWYFAKLFYLFNVLVSPGGFGLRYVAALAWFAGLYLLARQSRPLALLFGLPVLLLFIASAVHKYIIADRMVLFLSPHLIVPIAFALAKLARSKSAQRNASDQPDSDPPLSASPVALTSAIAASPQLSAAGAGQADRQLLAATPFATTIGLAGGGQVSAGAPLMASDGAARVGRRLMAAGLAAAFCLAPSGELARHLAELQPDGPDIRTAIAHLKEQYRPGDALYIEEQVEWIYAFYARREAFNAPFVLSNSGSKRGDGFKPLDRLQGAPRVWALLPGLGRSHTPNPRAAPFIEKAERVVTQHLDQLGRRLARVDAGNTRLYLYDLSRPGTVN